MGSTAKSLPLRVIPKPLIRATKLSDTVANTEKFALTLSQFLQNNNQDHVTAITDLNGQSTGGIVLAQHLPVRVQTYQYAAPIFPHVGDQPTQPSVMTYDGPLMFDLKTLPTGVNADHAYARWTGWITAPMMDTYTFQLDSSDGSNLFVNKQQLVGNLPAVGTTSESGSVALGDGPVPIVVEWQYGTSEPMLQLRYSTATQALTPVPNTWLSHTINQQSGFLLGYWTNGSQAGWYP